MNDNISPQGVSLKVGLLAGSVAGLVAALVSLPLHSPHDGLLNTGSVMLAALAAGVIAGQVWRLLPDGHSRTRNFLALALMAFGIVAVSAVIAESQINRAVSFIVPLASIAIAIAAVSIPYLARERRLIGWRVVLPAVAVALVVGAGLASQGDQESGRLELPPRSANVVPGGPNA